MIVATHYGLIDSVGSSKTKVVCPLHEDVNPSMILDFSSGVWYCFGCNASGNAQKLVAEIEHKYRGLNDFKSALKFSRILQSFSSERLPKFKVVKRTKAEDFELYAQAYDFYHGLSKVNWHSPQFSEAQDVLRYMQDRGFTAKTMRNAKAKVTFEKQYPMVFPMLDNGKFKGWVSRTTDSDLEKKRKYLYNEGFKRKDTLVGVYKNCRCVIIVEGYMDRLKLLQLGARNVVAILGWKISEHQIEKIKKEGVEYVVAATDNDEAGRKGSSFIKSVFPNVIRWPYLKGLKDPGDFDSESYKKMKERLDKLVRRARWDL